MKYIILFFVIFKNGYGNNVLLKINIYFIKVEDVHFYMIFDEKSDIVSPHKKYKII